MRKYADLGLIPKPIRKANGYRVFCNIHIDQFRLARTAFQIEVLQGGLRKKIISIVKISAKGHYDDAIALTHEYVAIAEAEIVNANEAVEIADKLLKKPIHENIILLKRKEVSDVIGVSMDTLRNWEMNGILKIKRKENGYRVYDNDDINKLKIIRSLRCANYSLSSILRLMNAFFENEYVDPKYVLNTPNGNEYIVSVCDKLIISLTIAKQNAEKIIELLIEMKNNYPNHTL